MPRAGEKPVIGKYRCMKCGLIIRFVEPGAIKEDTVLPRCSKCQYAVWAQIGTTRLENVEQF